jgi:ABC-type uncharacterized transport system YnjBCD permease subunit
MRKFLTKTILAMLCVVVFSCSTDDIRNITGPTGGTNPNPPYQQK